MIKTTPFEMVFIIRDRHDDDRQQAEKTASVSEKANEGEVL